MEEEVEVEVPLTFKRHSVVYLAIDVPGDLPRFAYQVAVSLADPFTQPEENDTAVLSVDLAADAVIGLCYLKLMPLYPPESLARHDIDLVKFDLAHALYTVIDAIHRHGLNVDSELNLRYVDNGEDRWDHNLHRWAPILAFEPEISWLYLACCILLWALAKLFGDNLVLNPYFHWLIKLWKCHTNVILLGLEIDRRLEFTQSLEPTPELVKTTLKGSLAIRYVLAAIINRNPLSLSDGSEEEKDLKHQSLVAFMQPLGREKINGGAILIDMRLVVVALLVLNINIPYVVGPGGPLWQDPVDAQEQARRDNQSKPVLELGDLLLDLEYDDRFDEDIRYIFEYEYDDDTNDGDEWHDHDPEGQLQKYLETRDAIEPIYLSITNGDSLAEYQSKELAAKPIGVDPIEFDLYGHDWRDTLRGDNHKFDPQFVDKYHQYRQLTDKEELFDFFTLWEELRVTLEFLATNSIDGHEQAEQKVGQVLLNTISKVNLDAQHGEDSDITVEKVYNLLTLTALNELIAELELLIVPIFEVSQFELFVHNNPKLAWCLMDELLCCPGYRRVFILFMTHNMNLSSFIIDYVFELLTGSRGASPAARTKNLPYTFSRQGPLVLLEVETLMLLHEFLNNLSLYLSARDGLDIDDGYEVVLAELVAKKYMTLLCLMINQLVAKGIIDLSRHHTATGDQDGHELNDYSNVLQVLLVNWIGKLPQARQLFFKVKGTASEPTAGEEEKPATLKKVKTIHELLLLYQSRLRDEITDDLETNRNHKAIVIRYTNKFCDHLEVARAQMLLPPSAHDDFALFLTHFNTFSKIDVAAEKLFSQFQLIVIDDDGDSESNGKGASQRSSGGDTKSLGKGKRKRKK